MEMYYDGKCEFPEFLENGGSESSIKRWIQYVLSSKKIDIDVSKWAMENYVSKYVFLESANLTLQSGETHKYEAEVNGVVFRGDTMTSFGNFIRKYIREKYKLSNIGKEMCAKRIQSGEYEVNDDYMIEFAYLQHTLGNLIPVPLYFNVERSGNFADCDYWDLTMYDIYMWCQTCDERYIYDLLDRYNKNTHMEESVKKFKEWMSIFHNNWEEFIKKNTLEALVDKDTRYPIEFWKNHFAFNRKIESLSLSELEETVKLINKLLKARNEDLNKL